MKLKLLTAGLTMAVLSSCSHMGRNELRSVSPMAERVHKALDETVIPEVDLENVTVQDALNIWSTESRTYHPQHFKFEHIISYPMVFTQGTAKPVAAAQSFLKVTVRRKNITSKRLLDEICQQANLTWTITGRVILIQAASQSATGQ